MLDAVRSVNLKRSSLNVKNQAQHNGVNESTAMIRVRFKLSSFQIGERRGRDGSAIWPIKSYEPVNACGVKLPSPVSGEKFPSDPIRLPPTR